MHSMSSRFWIVLLVVIVVGLVENPMGSGLVHALSLDNHIAEWSQCKRALNNGQEPGPLTPFDQALHEEVLNSDGLKKQRFLVEFAHWGSIDQLRGPQQLKDDYHFLVNARKTGYSKEVLSRNMKSIMDSVRREDLNTQFQFILAFAHACHRISFPQPDPKQIRDAIQVPFESWIEQMEDSTALSEFGHYLVNSWGYEGGVYPSFEPGHSFF